MGVPSIPKGAVVWASPDRWGFPNLNEIITMPFSRILSTVLVSYFIENIIPLSCIQSFKIRFYFGNGVQFSTHMITIVSVVVYFEIEFVVLKIISGAVFLRGKVVRSHRQADNKLYIRWLIRNQTGYMDL